jgi:anti-sigma B factor antagonist
VALFSSTKSTEPGEAVRVVCDQRGAECQLSLSGRITIDSSPALREALLRRLETPSCDVLALDLYDVAYIDTSGLAILVEILRAARRLGKQLRLSRLGERPRYLLETTRLLHLFENEPPHERPR